MAEVYATPTPAAFGMQGPGSCGAVRPPPQARLPPAPCFPCVRWKRCTATATR